jgi:hypothetical protein
VDQLPPPGLPSGLGRTGLEALAASSAVVTSMYDEKLVEGFFEYPPVLAVKDRVELITALRDLLMNGERLAQVQEQSGRWAAKYVELEPWLEYVGKHL